MARLVALLGVLLVAGAPARPQARPVAAVAHPRMLVGASDPLTGLPVLRARYAAGMRPSDDIAGWALTYLVTGDEAFARRAVDEMRRTHEPEQGRSNLYVEIVKWSLAFDWLSG
jgi:hypothetical protein